MGPGSEQTVSESKPCPSPRPTAMAKGLGGTRHSRLGEDTRGRILAVRVALSLLLASCAMVPVVAGGESSAAEAASEALGPSALAEKGMSGRLKAATEQTWHAFFNCQWAPLCPSVRTPCARVWPPCGTHIHHFVYTY